ncbi:hypothetical protein BDZ94DRAFT_1370545 [Collybia nuda]|uniref:Uncharacterized protein n=1 Tax=Collybia nuda TaxID=64659 RepID=A0A9P5Y1X6_9AGAR|nr:hypothetical protein BDZ94DRAFT_1370545 [Collybia nuda]
MATSGGPRPPFESIPPAKFTQFWQALIKLLKIGPPRRKKKVNIVTPDKIDNDEGQYDLPFSCVPPLPEVTRPITVRSPRKEQIPLTGKKPSAFRNKAPIEDEGWINDIVTKVIKIPLNLMAEDLMIVSKDFRDGLRSLITGKKVANNGTDLRNVNLSDLAITFDFEESAEKTDDNRESYIMVSDIPLSTFMISEMDSEKIPKGSIICHDPVVQYYDGLAPGEEPKNLIIVACESQTLRTVYPLINHEFFSLLKTRSL